MVVYRCSQCDVRISRPVTTLTDSTLLHDREDLSMEDPNGEPDYVPEGFVHKATDETADIPDTAGWPTLNPEDLFETSLDVIVAVGCCGPDGLQGLNTECRNGHKVGIERGDCWTMHSIALNPDRVIASDEADETVTPGLETAHPSVWLATAKNGSSSDRRRAIVLLGKNEVTDAVPVLSEIVTDGPEVLRESAVRSLGRIGADEGRRALVIGLHATDPSIRKAAVKALSELRDGVAVEELLDQLLEEPDPAVCQEIRRGLTGCVTVERLDACFDHARTEPAQKALLALLTETEHERVAERIQTVISDATLPTAVRRSAVFDITRLDIPQSETNRRLVDALAAADEPAIYYSCINELEERDIVQEPTRSKLHGILEDIQTDPDTDPSVKDRASRLSTAQSHARSSEGFLPKIIRLLRRGE